MIALKYGDDKMKAMCIRNINEKTFEKIKEAARESGLSVNKFVADLLSKAVNNDSNRFHDLDDILGSWDDEEYKLITKSVKAQRKIDRELWK